MHAPTESEPLSESPVQSDRIKPSAIIRRLMFLKCVSAAPFYIVGMYFPEYIDDYSWILYLEAFHHYHARIFYMLALYRCIAQIYVSWIADGLLQKHFVVLDCFFDFGVIILYVHEYFRLHNVKVLMNAYTTIHFAYLCISLFSYKKSKEIKVSHIV